MYNASSSDVGTYKCRLKNPAGEIQETVSLKIGKAKDSMSMDRDMLSTGRRLSQDNLMDKGIYY